jgi:hypothetical protein
MDKQVAQLTTPSADTRGKKITRYVLYAFCAVVVALPIYFSFSVYRSMADRTKVYSANYATAPLRKAAEAHYQKNGTLPRNLADLGVAPPGVPYLEALGFRDGMITFTPKDTHTRGTITWTPVVEGKTVSWHCSATGFRNGDLPSECRRQR